MFIEYRPTEYVAKTNNPKQGLLGIFYSQVTNGNKKNFAFNDLRSTFVYSINVFDCHLSEVFIEYGPTEYVAKTNNPKQWLLGIIYSRATNGNQKLCC